MGPRLVLDSNVLVSALGWRGPAFSLVRACLDGDCQLLLSPAILKEVEKVLGYSKFQFSEQEIAEYLELLVQAAKIFEPELHLSVVEEDPSDDRILECAVAGQADIIVSGDRHLIDLGTFEGIQILAPRQALDGLRRA